MKKKEILKKGLFIGSLLIIIALLIWREFSFVLGGFGIIAIGIGILCYLNIKE